MAVLVTVLIGAFCTGTAVVSMVVFGVSGWTVLMIYSVYCLAIVVSVAAAAIVVIPGRRKSEIENAFEKGNEITCPSNPLDGQVSVPES